MVVGGAPCLDPRSRATTCRPSSACSRAAPSWRSRPSSLRVHDHHPARGRHHGAAATLRPTTVPVSRRPPQGRPLTTTSTLPASVATENVKDHPARRRSQLPLTQSGQRRRGQSRGPGRAPRDVARPAIVVSRAPTPPASFRASLVVTLRGDDHEFVERSGTGGDVAVDGGPAVRQQHVMRRPHGCGQLHLGGPQGTRHVGRAESPEREHVVDDLLTRLGHVLALGHDHVLAEREHAVVPPCPPGDSRSGDGRGGERLAAHRPAPVDTQRERRPASPGTHLQTIGSTTPPFAPPRPAPPSRRRSRCPRVGTVRSVASCRFPAGDGPRRETSRTGDRRAVGPVRGVWDRWPPSVGQQRHRVVGVLRSPSSTAASSISPTSGEICSKRSLRASSRRDWVFLPASATAASASAPSLVRELVAPVGAPPFPSPSAASVRPNTSCQSSVMISSAVRTDPSRTRTRPDSATRAASSGPLGFPTGRPRSDPRLWATFAMSMAHAPTNRRAVVVPGCGGRARRRHRSRRALRSTTWQRAARSPPRRRRPCTPRRGEHTRS